MNLRELTKEQLAEESLIDLAYALLEEKKSPVPFLDLLKEIQELNGYSEEEIQKHLVQFYTDMNIDGRFLINQESGWGLREWYKVETIEEETAPTVKSRKRKGKAALDEDEEEIEIDEDDLVFEEDFEEFVEDEEEIEEDEDDIDDEDIDFDEDIDELDVDSEVDVDEDLEDDLIDEEDAFIVDDDIDDDLDEEVEDEDK
nr:DNA-directed RNA polymerase subunit delta [Lysinibacillus timonensis]